MSVYLSHPLFRSRKNKSRALKLAEHKPENLFALSLSLVLIWGGWLAFDGGSTLALNLRSFVALYTTQLSGSMGGFVWTMLHFMHTKKWSLAGFVSGAICVRYSNDLNSLLYYADPLTSTGTRRHHPRLRLRRIARFFAHRRRHFGRLLLRRQAQTLLSRCALQHP